LYDRRTMKGITDYLEKAQVDAICAAAKVCNFWRQSDPYLRNGVGHTFFVE
jgi:hypothetical protein